MISFKLNGHSVSLDVEDDTPLLWVIRDDIGLTGTKFGCGIGLCGACTVHVGGRATRSCITPVGAVNGAEITKGPRPVILAGIELQKLLGLANTAPVAAPRFEIQRFVVDGNTLLPQAQV